MKNRVFINLIAKTDTFWVEPNEFSSVILSSNDMGVNFNWFYGKTAAFGYHYVLTQRHDQFHEFIPTTKKLSRPTGLSSFCAHWYDDLSSELTWTFLQLPPSGKYEWAKITQFSCTVNAVCGFIVFVFVRSVNRLICSQYIAMNILEDFKKKILSQIMKII